jgi:hypothetical protein
MGETEYHSLIIGVARRAPLGLGIVYCLLSPLCMALIGGVLRYRREGIALEAEST